MKNTNIAKGFAFAIGLFGATLANANVSTSIDIGEPATLQFENVSIARALTQEQADLRLTISSHSRTYTLLLTENESLTASAATQWIGTGATGGNNTAFYEGVIDGFANSWARISIDGTKVSGMLYDGMELQAVETVTSIAKSQTATTVIYPVNEANNSLDPKFCGLDENLDEFLAQSSAKNLYNETVNEIHRALALQSDVKELRIALVADYEFYQIHGANTAAVVQSVMNQVDGIYESEFGVSIAVTDIVVFTDAAALTSSTDSLELLRHFGDVITNSGSPIALDGIAHLFTGRDLDGTTLGLGYVGTVCDGSKYSVSLSQNYDRFASGQVIIAAHELGHNLGASHDTGECDARNIMAPSISSATQMTFSQCSADSVAPNLNKSCFAALPDLSIVVVENSDAESEDKSFTVTVSNASGVNASAAQVRIDDHTGLTIDGMMSSQGECTLTESTAVCEIGSLYAGQQISISIAASGSADGVITASVSAAESDANATNNTDSSNSLLIQSSLQTESQPQSSGGGGGGSFGWMLALLLLTLITVHTRRQIFAQTK